MILHNTMVGEEKTSGMYVFNDLKNPPTFEQPAKNDKDIEVTAARWFEDVEGDAFDQLSLGQQIQWMNENIEDDRTHAAFHLYLIKHIDKYWWPANRSMDYFFK